MAFQSMMNGSECSTGASPLASLLKQQGTDNSLHHSQFQQPGSSGAHSMRQHQGPQLAHDEAERFFQQQAQQQQGGQFAMEGLRRELESVQREGKGPIIGDRGAFFCLPGVRPGSRVAIVAERARSMWRASCGRVGKRLVHVDCQYPDRVRKHVLTASRANAEWASQYHPASSSLSPAEAAHLEEQFRQSRSNEFSGAHPLLCSLIMPV